MGRIILGTDLMLLSVPVFQCFSTFAGSGRRLLPDFFIGHPLQAQHSQSIITIVDLFLMASFKWNQKGFVFHRTLGGGLHLIPAAFVELNREMLYVST